MSTWLKEGKVKFREDIDDGLENAPQAFIGLLDGKRFGKLIIRVANDTPHASMEVAMKAIDRTHAS